MLDEQKSLGDRKGPFDDYDKDLSNTGRDKVTLKPVKSARLPCTVDLLQCNLMWQPDAGLLSFTPRLTGK